METRLRNINGWGRENFLGLRPFFDHYSLGLVWENIILISFLAASYTVLSRFIRNMGIFLFPLENKKIHTKMSQSVCSLINSAILTRVAAYLVWKNWNTDLSTAALEYSPDVMALLCLSLGYFFWDIVKCIKHVDISGWEFVLHAMLGLGGLLVCAQPYGQRIVPFYAMFEASTIFLQMNYFCIKAFGKGSLPYKISNFFFQVLFFIFRIVLGPYWNYKAICMTMDTANTASSFTKAYYLFNGIGLLCLSNVWFVNGILQEYFGISLKSALRALSKSPVEPARNSIESLNIANDAGAGTGANTATNADADTNASTDAGLGATALNAIGSSNLIKSSMNLNEVDNTQSLEHLTDSVSPDTVEQMAENTIAQVLDSVMQPQEEFKQHCQNLTVESPPTIEQNNHHVAESKIDSALTKVVNSCNEAVEVVNVVPDESQSELTESIDGIEPPSVDNVAMDQGQIALADKSDI